MKIKLLSFTLVMVVLLTGCAGQITSQKAHDDCVYGLGMMGAASGGVAGNLPGILVGITVGTAVGFAVCGTMDTVEHLPATPATPATKADKPILKPSVATVRDSDNDGIIDMRDQCWNTPDGVRVNNVGCGVDSDNDGVPDHRDQCANTAANVVVDTTGCAIASVGTEFVRVHFDTDSATLKPEAKSTLDSMLAGDNQNRRFYIAVGHTDNRHSDAYNDELSLRRARSVVDYLVARGIPKSRLETRGKGEHEPIATNATPEGRAQNRRVEIIVQ